MGQIRIISGYWRGRKLPVLNSPGLRPTTDRMRETLFNWLAPVIRGAHCLDCFAGSGALGFEALSRSAASVILLEQNSKVSAQLTSNVLALKAQQAEVITTNSLYWLTTQLGIVFDIVFIDPPFHHGMITTIVTTLEQYQRLADTAWIYIKSEIECYAPKVPIYWKLHRKKNSGQVTHRLYLRHSSTPKNICDTDFTT